MSLPVHSVILGFARLWPLGLSPRAPGTVASLASALAAPWLFLVFPLPLRLALLAVFFVLGGLAADFAEKSLGRKDPSSVVIDELLGQWLALLPLLTAWQTVTNVPGPAIGPESARVPLLLILLGFALFRLFDIWKPWPVKASETWLPGGWGIMIDDVVAGCFGLAVFLAMLKGMALVWG